ncbi:hypothetical protein ES332_D11G109000v1 [Gossypium tomentosum]|uniref:Reverse transcriptase zinc-binding domain-containing protein n=1 Tax=Gossypium tomentosum TaxID=34277 RepID=A0A5D2IKW0_GOSTO|nr:hypothetical protein ES332_D11G109000v1 [Gossypium tomentosum]
MKLHTHWLGDGILIDASRSDQFIWWPLTIREEMVRTQNWWKPIWNFRGPQRVRVFLWIVCSDKLLTNQERKRRRMTMDDRCSLCGVEVENMDHVLQSCIVAPVIWKRLVRKEKFIEFVTMQFPKWVHCNLSNPRYFAGDNADWDILFGLLRWNLWKCRNMLVFYEDFVELESILEVSLRMQQQYTFAMESLEVWLLVEELYRIGMRNGLLNLLDSLVPVRHWKRNFRVLLKAFDLPGGVDNMDIVSMLTSSA